MSQMKCGRIEPLFGCGIAGILRACEGFENMLPIVHGPVGCAAGHRIYPLFAGKEPLLVTTTMTEIDIIMGSEQRILAAIEKGIEIYKPSVIVVILTCGTNMTGEIHPSLGGRIEKQYGIPCFVLNGSGIELDEQTAYLDFLQAYRDWEDAHRDSDAVDDGFELVGFSRADFNCEKDLAVVENLLKDSFDIKPRRTLFREFRIGDNLDKKFRPIYIANAWTLAESGEPAPIGAEGIRRWLDYAGGTVDRKPGSALLQELDTLEAYCRTMDISKLRIGIECGSWLGLGLARFLNEECGCRVLLSTDRQAEKYIAAHDLNFDVLRDMGNLEFSDALDDFGADIVFGTSYSKSNDRAWVPVWQPVWHVIDEQESMLGINGTKALLEMLSKYCANR